MNSRIHRTACRAFTLVELLVVMAIITVLAALTLGAFSGIQGEASRSRAAAEIKALSVALEDYRRENGVFPYATLLAASEDPDGDPFNYLGSEVTDGGSGSSYAGYALFYYLTGYEKMDITDASDDELGPNYFPELKQTMVESSGSEDYFIDPWGYAYGYRSLDAGNAGTDSSGQPIGLSGYNIGFFDLWSTGNGVTNDEEDLVKWIVNWKDPTYDRRYAQ
ncbi:MAG: prepilin-type N-terminal cleavage/methylation domain-containing protein [Verrucomicrobiota bacterium]